MPENEITLEDIHNDLHEILKWMKISGIRELTSVLKGQFKDDSKKMIYQLSDGTKGTRKIAEIVGNVTHTTVFNYWKFWEKIGLGEPVAVKGGTRFKRLFDLTDFGVKVPKTKTDMKEPYQTKNSTGSQIEGDTENEE